MEYAQASKIVQEYTGLNLLEALESIQQQLCEPYHADMAAPAEVLTAYYTLMAGFTAMMAPRKEG